MVSGQDLGHPSLDYPKEEYQEIVLFSKLKIIFIFLI
jgi:hypothetical protein